MSDRYDGRIQSHYDMVLHATPWLLTARRSCPKPCDSGPREPE